MAFRKILSHLSFAVMVIALVTPVSGLAQQQNCFLQTADKPGDNFTTFTEQKDYTDKDKLVLITPAKYYGNPDFGKSFIGKHFADSAQWYERIDKRTLKSRSYINANNPSNVLVESGYDNINYIDEKGWIRAVDTKLKPVTDGWSAVQQETPVYLFDNAGTAISIGNGQLMVFNKNVQFNSGSISTSNYTVGDNGMYIKNASLNTDKIIRFGRGSIETDYKINAPLKLSGDLTISEDIILPTGYTLTADAFQQLVVRDVSGKTVATLKTPFCYDCKNNTITGSYKIHQQTGGYRLEIDVPSKWLNDAQRKYPVIIDPVVIGSLYIYSGGKIGSCYSPLRKDIEGEDTGILHITIPANITVTNFLVQIGTYAPLVPPDSTEMFFTAGCGDTVFATDTSTKMSNSYEYLVADFIKDINSAYLGCYPPSCDSSIITLKVALIRMMGGSECDDTTYFYYDPANNFGYPFEAYVEGYTVQTKLAGAGYTITPDPVCGSVCTIKLVNTSIYGVPPYTISHPWAANSATYGGYDKATATSTGTVFLPLTIPSCPEAACVASGITVPPPTIVDACGDTVSGLTSLVVPVTPAPDVTYSSIPNPDSVCSGNNVNITLSSCISGTAFKWSGSDSSGGSGSTISDEPVNNDTLPITVTYTVTPTSPGGCAGTPVAIPVVVSLSGTLDIEPPSPNICSGQAGVYLYVSAKGETYTWSPATGLSSTTGDSVLANPTTQVTYTVTGKDTLGCVSTGTDVVGVIPAPNKPTITVSVTGDTLFSSATTDNQWNFNGSPVNGATDSFFVIKGHTKGWYSVTVTNEANGCSTTSDSTTSINQLSVISDQLSIYPNPFNNNIFIKINSAVKNVNDWMMELTDVLGRTVYSKPSMNYSNIIDLSYLPDGVYFITIINKTGGAVFPVIKQN